MLAALLSSLTNAVCVITDKVILTRERVSLKVFLPSVFLLLFCLNLVLVPFFGRIDWQIAMLPNTMFLLFLMVVIAMAWNVLIAENLQKEKLHQHELIMMLAPFITIVLGATFFPEDFDRRVFILGLIASLALIWAKSTKEHFFTKGSSYNALLGVILMSTESVIIRDLLYSFTPVALYGIRTLFIGLFFFLYYRPQTNRVSSKHWLMIGFSALMGLILMLSRFYAFSEVGIVYTTLITILAPVIVFFASWEILHERIRPRMIIASLIILACVTWATVLAFG